jgi:hypothetical protein
MDGFIICCEKDLNIMRSIRGKEWGTDKKCLYKFYEALILCKIYYGCIIYNSSNDKQKQRLQTMQNKAVKISLTLYEY